MNLTEDNITNSSFYELYKPYYLRMSALLLWNIVIGLPANIYVVWQICRGGEGAVTAEFFALNQAIGEVVLCIGSLGSVLVFLLRMDEYIGYFLFYILLQLMYISRPLFQGWICLERYVAVVHPTIFIRIRPLRYRSVCGTVTWLIILIDILLIAFFIPPEQLFFLLQIHSMFFLVLMLYCGLHALCVLRQPGPGDGGKERESQNSMKRKASKIIGITLVSSITVQALLIFILAPIWLFASTDVSIWAIVISLAISIYTGFVPPLLYIHRAGKLPCIKL